MGDFLPPLLVVAGFGAVAATLLWLARRVRRRGVAGAMLVVADEIFHPSGQLSHYEIQAAEERQTPMPSADDKP